MLSDTELIQDAIATCIHQMEDQTIVVKDAILAQHFVERVLRLETWLDDVNGGFEFRPKGQTGTGSGKKVRVWGRV